MTLPLEIAKRYLFSKKSTNAINLITGISILGISIGTAALILILSVFNGFETLITAFLDNFNPDVKIQPVEGKYFADNDSTYYALASIAGVEAITKTLEEVAIFEYNGTSRIGVIKGVDDQFQKVNHIEGAITHGEFDVHDPDIAYAVIGDGIASQLSISIKNRLRPMTIYFPKRKKKSVLEKDFSVKDFYPTGVFSIQNESDYHYAIADLENVAPLLDRKSLLSSYEIKLSDTENPVAIQNIKKQMGPGFTVKDRFEQDSTYLKIMNIEKWMSFLIVSLTIIIVAFNLIGSLWMIVLDKKRDIATLKSMGATDDSIQKIFLYEGLLITFFGILLGFVIAIVLYLLQVNIGLISMAEGFIIDSYPIRLKITDFIIVFLSVFVIGLLASLGPANKAAKIPAFIREE